MSAGDWKEMYVAAQNGNLELLRYHIQNGANPNYQHPEILSTPLVTAIFNGHTHVALFLLENGADPYLRSYYDDLSATEAAVKYQNQTLLNYFAQAGIRTTLTRAEKLRRLVARIFRHY